MTVSSKNMAVDIGRFRYQGLVASYILSEDLFVWREKNKSLYNLYSINWFNSGILKSIRHDTVVFTFTGGSQVSWLPRSRRIGRHFHVKWSSSAKQINENTYRSAAQFSLPHPFLAKVPFNPAFTIKQRHRRGLLNSLHSNGHTLRFGCIT